MSNLRDGLGGEGTAPRFNVLGSLEIVHNGRSITPSPPKVRRVLALMVVRANQVVHPDSLIAELWGHTPPKSAMTTLQTYIYHLRRMFTGEGIDSFGEELLVTQHPGYILRLSKHALDAEVFERLASEGHDHLERGLPSSAALLLRDALALWSGPALANVSLGGALEAHAVRLEERRIHVLQLRIQADLELGRHREIIGELRSLTSTYPLNEWFSGQLITALAHAGRRSEALNAYRKIRTLLRDELGLDPSPYLQNVLQDVLASTLDEPHRPSGSKAADSGASAHVRGKLPGPRGAATCLTSASGVIPRQDRPSLR